jgi:hypothetical protein
MRIILPLLVTVLFNAIVYGALLVHPGAYFNVPRGSSERNALLFCVGNLRSTISLVPICYFT